MREMHVALLNNIRYCVLPKGIQNVAELAALLNSKFHSFIELELLVEDGCVAPFFIEEDLRTEIQFWNVSRIHHIAEKEVSILRRWEYQERLHRVMQEKCIHCKHCLENVCGYNDEPFAEAIDLNGECYGFEREA